MIPPQPQQQRQSNETYLFSEEPEALSCLDAIVNDNDDNKCDTTARCSENDRDAALTRFRTIVDKYLECPTLLDPSLERLIECITTPTCRSLTIRMQQQQQQQELYSSSNNNKTRHSLSALYALSKVRGIKTIQRFLPHRVEDVPVIWSALAVALQEQQQQQDSESSPRDAPGNVLSSRGVSDDAIAAPLWESIYILWYWMGVLSLVPFDCHVLVAESSSWLDTLLQTARNHLSAAGPTREGAATCLAAWLTRPDVCSCQPEEKDDGVAATTIDHWSVFLKWAHEHVIQSYRSTLISKMSGSSNGVDCGNSSPSGTLFCVLGVLQTLTTMLKVSSMDRTVLVQRLYPLWGSLLDLSETTGSSNLLLSKKLVKWWTRMACAHLPVQSIAPWRYQRGKRSLTENLLLSSKASIKLINGTTQAESTFQNSATTSTTSAATAASAQESTLLLWDVPDSVEDAMGRVLEALGHSSTIVRWSAAKGVGRITERLPAVCADDVLDAILLYFDNPDKDQCYHGSCLALAELARRGLLLPNQLDRVVPHVVRAIQYDVRRGSTSSVGAHVRDAACYTYWAFARAYSPSILRPYWKQLSEAIVLVSLFDREVNCRRAASASFQEAVGRQGAINVPNGIAVLTAADYFSLGNRTDAYRTIAWTVAKFDEYRKPIIDHLYKSKLFHWDIQIRILSSKSFHGLVSLDINYFCSIVQPFLMEHSLDLKNLHIRHGAVLGVAEITLALAGIDQLSAISTPNMEKLQSLVSIIEKKRLYRGRGGEIMRSAVCRLVECISIAQVPLAVKDQVALLDSVDASIPHPSERIQNDACAALKQLMEIYFPVGDQGPSQRLQARVVDKLVKAVRTSDNPAATRGYALALGYLPPKLIAPSSPVLDSVLTCLIEASHHDSLVGGESDAETRRNALLSLSRVAEKVGISSVSAAGYPLVCLTADHISQLFTSFFLGLNDYKTDRRGDVGSWCRTASMDGLTSLMRLLISSGESIAAFRDDLATRAVGALLKQLAERLDTVRRRSGECLETILLQTTPRIPGIAGHDALLAALDLNESIDTCQNWTDPVYTFPKLMQAASVDQDSDVYLQNVVFGVVLSIGGLTETVSTQAASALLKWTKDGDTARRQKLGQFLLLLLKQHRGSQRIILPVLKTIDMLLSHQSFDELIQSTGSKYALSCQELLEKEEAVCKDVHRLFAIVDVSVSLLNATVVDLPLMERQQRSLSFLCEMLAHEYPRVRTHVAQQFYLYLLERPTTDDHVLDVVLNTPWASEPFCEQKKSIAEIAGLLDVRDEVDRRLQSRR